MMTYVSGFLQHVLHATLSGYKNGAITYEKPVFLYCIGCKITFSSSFFPAWPLNHLASYDIILGSPIRRAPFHRLHRTAFDSNEWYLTDAFKRFFYPHWNFAIAEEEPKLQNLFFKNLLIFRWKKKYSLTGILLLLWGENLGPIPV